MFKNQGGNLYAFALQQKDFRVVLTLKISYNEDMVRYLL